MTQIALFLGIFFGTTIGLICGFCIATVRLSKIMDIVFSGFTDIARGINDGDDD